MASVAGAKPLNSSAAARSMHAARRATGARRAGGQVVLGRQLQGQVLVDVVEGVGARGAGSPSSAMAGTSSGSWKWTRAEGPVAQHLAARRPGPGGTGRHAPGGSGRGCTTSRGSALQPGRGGGPARGTKTWVSTPHSRQAASSRSNTRRVAPGVGGGDHGHPARGRCACAGRPQRQRRADEHEQRPVVVQVAADHGVDRGRSTVPGEHQPAPRPAGAGPARGHGRRPAPGG